MYKYLNLQNVSKAEKVQEKIDIDFLEWLDGGKKTLGM